MKKKKKKKKKKHGKFPSCVEIMLWLKDVKIDESKCP